jgi:hypothetical protein
MGWIPPCEAPRTYNSSALSMVQGFIIVDLLQTKKLKETKMLV